MFEVPKEMENKVESAIDKFNQKLKSGETVYASDVQKDIFHRIKEVATAVSELEYRTGLSCDLLSQLIDWLVHEREWSYSEAFHAVEGLLLGTILVKEDYYEQESRKETDIAERNDPEASA